MTGGYLKAVKSETAQLIRDQLGEFTEGDLYFPAEKDKFLKNILCEQRDMLTEGSSETAKCVSIRAITYSGACGVASTNTKIILPAGLV